MKKCAGCHVTYYCSPECQKAAWKAHKTACKILRPHFDDKGTLNRESLYKIKQLANLTSIQKKHNLSAEKLKSFSSELFGLALATQLIPEELGRGESFDEIQLKVHTEMVDEMFRPIFPKQQRGVDARVEYRERQISRKFSGAFFRKLLGMDSKEARLKGVSYFLFNLESNYPPVYKKAALKAIEQDWPDDFQTILSRFESYKTKPEDRAQVVELKADIEALADSIRKGEQPSPERVEEAISAARAFLQESGL
ncbi:MAG: hypothetical protein S4CHLAM81_00390 [Chlamydiales bacterium]|nr:hypothetical protein [Chlamydiales bacterium]MCH9634841.1 hypothetical protein [Chlamydiales bacterium]MCH9703664.1 zinc finger MYND domain-containing protein [Chlamydiota bacterium]